MITIEDYDSPITAAQKIIHGLTGKDMSEENYMFSVEEIKEISGSPDDLLQCAQGGVRA